MRRKIFASLRLFVIWILNFQALFGLVYAEEYNLLEYDVWDGVDNNENHFEIYKPYPVIFVHGFAGGGPRTWDEILENAGVTYTGLKYHFEPYKDYELIQGKIGYGDFKNFVEENRLPYLERMDMKDRNGSVDTYNSGDELILYNPQSTVDGWADKLRRAIDAALADSGAEKVMLVCHSMGGLAARELVTNANSNYGDYTSKVDRIITIATPHAGSPLARMASNMGNIYRHGWKFPGIGWLLTILVTPLKSFMSTYKDVDLNGEAVRDMNPTELEGALRASGSHFLKNLGELRYEPNQNDIYTISGVSSDSFAILLSGGGALANEPSDGIVPLPSQRGYPFVRDSDNGNYVVENSRILTQQRMFENPEKIDSNHFLDPQETVVWNNPSFFIYLGLDIGLLDTEAQIKAAHAGSDGAAFVASGLARQDGIAFPKNSNYIIKYLDYLVPELSVIDSSWKISGSLSHLKVTHKYLLGLDNERLPATCKLFAYDSKTSHKWSPFPGLVVRPFENQNPFPAGFESEVWNGFSITNSNPLTQTQNLKQNMPLKVVNPGGVGSNAIEFQIARIKPDALFFVWRILQIEDTDFIYINGAGTSPPYGYAASEQDVLTDCYVDSRERTIKCSNGQDGIMENEQNMLVQFSLPEEYRGWPVRSAILLFSGTNGMPRVSYSSTLIDSSITWDNQPVGIDLELTENEIGIQYADITSLISSEPVLFIIKPPASIADGAYYANSHLLGCFIEFEPREFQEVE